MKDPVNEPTRVMPQAVELEESVLGATMLERDAPPVSVNLLEPEMFYKDEHRVIFAAIKRMYEAGEPIDIQTVYIHLRSRKTTEIVTGQQYATEADKVGGSYYISRLTDRVASAANLEYHCRILIQKWVLRQIIHVGSRAVNRSYNEDPDIFSVLDEIGDLLIMRDKLVSSSAETPVVGNLIGEEIEDYDARVAANNTGRLIGVPTGHRQLDLLTMGWGKGKLIVEGGRPRMGKSAFAGGSALAAAEAGFPVAFFSLEMPKLELVQRYVTGIAEVDNYLYNRGQLNQQDIHKINAARFKLTTLPLFIDDTAGLSITDLRQRCRRLKQRKGLAMVVVDYLQLMEARPSDRRNGNREQEISAISRGLKAMAKELDVPVIALSQLSRLVDNRPDKRPMLSDLRESGAIEQDADMVLFVYREGVYDEEAPQDTAEIIIAKHRGGFTGTVNLKFIGAHTKFTDPNPIASHTPTALNRNVDFQHESKKDPF